MTATDNLVFAKLTNFSLCVGRCPNSHLHIFGFPCQLQGAIDTEAMIMTTRAPCRDCGCEVVRVDRLEYGRDAVMGGLGI